MRESLERPRVGKESNASAQLASFVRRHRNELPAGASCWSSSASADRTRVSSLRDGSTVLEEILDECASGTYHSQRHAGLASDNHSSECLVMHAIVLMPTLAKIVREKVHRVRIAQPRSHPPISLTKTNLTKRRVRGRARIALVTSAVAVNYQTLYSHRLSVCPRRKCAW
jgi:hypothetical protein